MDKISVVWTEEIPKQQIDLRRAKDTYSYHPPSPTTFEIMSISEKDYMATHSTSIECIYASGLKSNKIEPLGVYFHNYCNT